MSSLQKIKIQGPGLKKQGIVILQSIFISFFVFIELTFRNGTGVVSGIAICIATFGSLRFGRPGTTYVSAVTAPLAFAASTLFFTILAQGFRPSQVGIDFIAGLASAAPFLIISALVGWYIYLNQKAKARPSKARRPTD